MGARILLTAVLLLAACDKPEIAPNATGGEAAARGKTAAERLGCGACHAMSGIWPQGTTGPSLERFAQRGMIAGRYPNRPDNLAAFLRNSSGTAMPTGTMTAAQADDIAAFLHEQ